MGSGSGMGGMFGKRGGNRRLMEGDDMMGGMGGMFGDMMGGMGGMGGDMSDKMRGAMDKVKGGMNKMGGKGMGLMKALKQCMCETCQREDSCMDMSGSGSEGEGPAGSEEPTEDADCETNKYVVMAAGKK